MPLSEQMRNAPSWNDYLVALARKDQPLAIFRALETIAKERVGAKLFTASVFDMQDGRSRRVYSENEEAYPTGGFKPITPGPWTDKVLVRHEPYCSLTIEEIAAVFPDWPLIQSLGLESCLNVPVIAAGAVIGTINMLHEAGYYTPARVAAAMTLLPFAAIAFLMAAQAPASSAA